MDSKLLLLVCLFGINLQTSSVPLASSDLTDFDQQLARAVEKFKRDTADQLNSNQNGEDDSDGDDDDRKRREFEGKSGFQIQ